MSTKMEKTLRVSQHTRRLMRLFSHWLECWEEEIVMDEMSDRLVESSFGLIQLRGLRETLDKLERELEPFEEH